MGDVDDEALEWAVEQGIEFNVFERQRLVQAVQLARPSAEPPGAPEIETGMHRTGFPPEDLAGLLKWTATCTDALQLMGICTHLAGAESMANAFRVQEQKERYRDALRLADASGQDTGLRHVACSAGVLNEPDMLYDMARVGILQYGFWPNRETEVRFRKQHNILRPAAPGHPLAQPDHEPHHRPAGELRGLWDRLLRTGGPAAGRGARGLRVRLRPQPEQQRAGAGARTAGPVRGIVNMNCITIDVTGIEGRGEGRRGGADRHPGEIAASASPPSVSAANS